MGTPCARRRACNRWIPPEHVAQILSAMRPEDQQICRALYATGYRVDDVLSARVGDLSEDRVSIREHKTGHLRTVALEGAREVARIADYTRPRRMDQHTDYLIPARHVRSDGHERHLCRSTIWRAFARACRVVGLAGRGYTVHSLRRCYAVDIYQQTHSIDAVRAALGHDRASTTLIYMQDYFDTCARAFAVTSITINN